MIIFHLTDWFGSDVAEDISGLIDIQTTVRESFGWDYQSDLLSANLLVNHWTMKTNMMLIYGHQTIEQSCLIG